MNHNNINDIYNDTYDDPEVWDLIATGHTLAGFQIESQLLASWSKKLKPRNIIELAALISAVRPGVLNARNEDGVSMAEIYRRRKMNEEKIEYLHPLMEPILQDTAGTLLFQEQLTRIAEVIAGFTLVEADELRKGVSKKIPSEVARMKTIFIDKADKKALITREQATTLYEQFEASARYLFCRAHAIGYAIIAYHTMKLKVHKRLSLFKSWLKFAESGPYPKEKIELLYYDSKYFGVNIELPCVLRSDINFSVVDKTDIYFGLSNINGLGEKHAEKIKAAISQIDNINAVGMNELIFRLDLTTSIFKKLLEVGAFRKFTPVRKKYIYYVEILNDLTKREKKICADNIANFTGENRVIDLLNWLTVLKSNGGTCLSESSSLRIKSIIRMLEKPTTDLNDYVDDIVDKETELLGISLTCSKLDKFNSMDPNTTLLQYSRGKNTNFMVFGVEVKKLTIYTMSKGPMIGCEMARLTLQDKTAICHDAVIWTDVLERLKDDNILYEGAKLIIHGERDAKGSLVVKFAKKMVKT